MNTPMPRTRRYIFNTVAVVSLVLVLGDSPFADVQYMN
jgi:hypothetical protein